MADQSNTNKILQFELLTKLAEIFMPYSKKQRDIYYNNPSSPMADVSARFVHYTSAEAALNIINSKRVWMRNATCMSDYSEIQHGCNILKNFFSDDTNKKDFISALDSCAVGSAASAINAFDSWWPNAQAQTYIASISEHDETENRHGRLSMWRAFGNSTTRVAIVFKMPWASLAPISLKLIFSPVAYLTDSEFINLTRTVVKNIETNRVFLQSVDRTPIIQTVFAMLLWSVTCLKHEAFREEREWRAIYSPSNPSDLMESSIEVINGVPQPIYKIPLDEKKGLYDLEFSRIFDSLIIGPSQYGNTICDAFVYALEGAGVEEPRKRVLPSKIPIRT